MWYQRQVLYEPVNNGVGLGVDLKDVTIQDRPLLAQISSGSSLQSANFVI